MSKRGQITIFVIIGILIIAIIALFFLFKNNISSSKESIPSDASPIYDFIKSCVKQTSSDGIYAIGSKGGYYFSPEFSTDNGEAYYVYKNKSWIPEKKTIESQLGAYIRINLRRCLKDFNAFPSFNISAKDISVNTSFEKNKFVVNAHYPVLVKKGSFSYEFSDFRDIDIPTNSYLLYDIALNYSSLYLKTKALSLTYASDIEDSSNVISNFQYFPNYTLVSLTYNMTYQWRFALG